MTRGNPHRRLAALLALCPLGCSDQAPTHDSARPAADAAADLTGADRGLGDAPLQADASADLGADLPLTLLGR